MTDEWYLESYPSGRYGLYFQPKGVTYQGYLDWLTDEDFYALYLKLIEWGFVTKAQEAADRKVYKHPTHSAKYVAKSDAEIFVYNLFNQEHP